MSIILKSVAFCLLLILGGCNNTPTDWIVTVDETAITERDLRMGLLNINQNVQNQIPQEQQPQYVLNQLIRNEILYQEALSMNLNQEEDYKKFVNQLTQQYEYEKKQALVNLLIRDMIDKNINVNEQEIVDIYQKNKDTLFSEYEERSISHIVVPSQEEAQNILAQLNRGGNFETLAQTKSLDVNSAKSGGNLGYFRKNLLSNNFSDVIFEFKNLGSYSQPIQTEAGFHIVKLNDIRLVPAKSFDDVKDQITKQVYLNKRYTEIDKYIEGVSETYPISQNEEQFEAPSKDSAAKPAS